MVPEAISAGSNPAEETPVTWDDVLDSIAREIWLLTPEEYQRCAHRDITFLTTWQDIMAAVDAGIYKAGSPGL